MGSLGKLSDPWVPATNRSLYREPVTPPGSTSESLQPPPRPRPARGFQVPLAPNARDGSSFHKPLPDSQTSLSLVPAHPSDPTPSHRIARGTDRFVELALQHEPPTNHQTRQLCLEIGPLRGEVAPESRTLSRRDSRVCGSLSGRIILDEHEQAKDVYVGVSA